MIQSPRIGQTGIILDYWNEYDGIVMAFELEPEMVPVEIKNFRIKKYEEMYPIQNYGVVVDENNKGRVQRLNELADIINLELADPKKFSEKRFKEVVNEAYRLISGNGPYFPEDTGERKQKAA